MVRGNQGFSRGAEGSKLYTRSGYVLNFNPFDDEKEDSGYVLEIPKGKRFIRKLIARFSALDKSRTVLEVSDLRGAIKHLDGIRNTYGRYTAKEVRYLAAQILSGFTVVSTEYRGGYDEWLKSNGITLLRDGRNVYIKDRRGEITFTDDYYNTGLKACFWEYIKKGQLALAFTDARERASVKRVFGGTEDELLVGALLSGDYMGRSASRFWGGKGLENVRPVEIRERKKFGQTVRLERKQMSYKRSLGLHTGGWFEIVRDVLKNDINPADREYYKDKLARNEYRKMKKELSRRPREGGKSLEAVGHWVASYLEQDFLRHGKREEALSFILRGAQDFLQWDGGMHSQYVSVLRALGTLDQKK